MVIIPVVRESEVLTGTEAEGYHAWSNQLSAATLDIPYSNISGEQSLNRRFWLCGFNKAANDAHEAILKRELLSLRDTTESLLLMDIVLVMLEDGNSLRCSESHQFVTNNGLIPACSVKGNIITWWSPKQNMPMHSKAVSVTLLEAHS